MTSRKGRRQLGKAKTYRKLFLTHAPFDPEAVSEFRV